MIHLGIFDKIEQVADELPGVFCAEWH